MQGNWQCAVFVLGSDGKRRRALLRQIETGPKTQSRQAAPTAPDSGETGEHRRRLLRALAPDSVASPAGVQQSAVNNADLTVDAIRAAQLLQASNASKEPAPSRPYDNTKRLAKMRGAAKRRPAPKRSFAELRADQNRLSSVRSRERCLCAAGACFSQMSRQWDRVQETVAAFSECAQAVQDSLLAAASADVSRRAKMRICGFGLSRGCWCHLLMVSRSRLKRKAAGRPDRRTRAGCVKRKPKKKAMHAFRWLIKKYISLAEPLPDRLRPRGSRRLGVQQNAIGAAFFRKGAIQSQAAAATATDEPNTSFFAVQTTH